MGQSFDFLGVRIHTNDIVSELCHRRRVYGTEVSASDDGNPHVFALQALLLARRDMDCTGPRSSVRCVRSRFSDNADAQYAPRGRSTARIVLRMITMSLLIDQFS